MSRKNRCLLIFFTFLLFLLRLKTFKRPEFVSGQKIRITACLSQEPKFIGSRQIFILVGVKVSTWRYPEYHFGERLKVEGVVKKGGLINPEIEKIGENRGILSSITSLKRKIERVFRQSLPEPQASLLSGMVLGSKSDFPQKFYHALKKTGTLHVVVASGMNVTMLAGFLLSLFGCLYQSKAGSANHDFGNLVLYHFSGV